MKIISGKEYERLIDIEKRYKIQSNVVKKLQKQIEENKMKFEDELRIVEMKHTITKAKLTKAKKELEKRGYTTNEL